MFDWVTEWWSVFIWIGIYLLGVGVSTGLYPFTGPGDGNFPWEEVGDAKGTAWFICFIWPLLLGCGLPIYLFVRIGKRIGLGTHRLILAIKRWWDRFARWRDCRKNSKLVKGKNDGIPKATARNAAR